jgi:hypothetical protein
LNNSPDYTGLVAALTGLIVALTTLINLWINARNTKIIRENGDKIVNAVKDAKRRSGGGRSTDLPAPEKDTGYNGPLD